MLAYFLHFQHDILALALKIELFIILVSFFFPLRITTLEKPFAPILISIDPDQSHSLAFSVLREF